MIVRGRTRATDLSTMRWHWLVSPGTRPASMRSLGWMAYKDALGQITDALEVR